MEEPENNHPANVHHTYLIIEQCYRWYSELHHNLPHVSSMYITPHTPNNNFLNSDIFK